MSVIMTTEIVPRVFSGSGTPSATKTATRRLEKLSAAKALARKPDSVIATCIVARKVAGLSVSFLSLPARASPCAVSWSSLAPLTEMTAISAHAKIAFEMMSTTCKMICHNMLSSKMIPPRFQTAVRNG